MIEPVKISFAASLPASIEGALVVGAWDGARLGDSARVFPAAAAAVERALAASPVFDGKAGDVLEIRAPAGMPACSRILVAGLGPAGDMDEATARRIGAEIGAVLAAGTETTAALALGLTAGPAAACAYGLRLRTHRLPDYRSTVPSDDRRHLAEVTVQTDDPSATEDAWRAVLPTVQGIELARSLMAEPANRLTPEAFVERARTLEPLGVAVEVLDETALAEAGLGLHCAVGQASAHPPRLAVLRWRGAPDREAPPILLVGKGLTFDSGGLSIKPAQGMEEMKGDMGGAAAVIGALHALAAERVPVNVTGLLALAENMPGGNAYRPGDVLRSHAGLTVEVVDTDAEGRLVLADALSWGCVTERPAAAVDLATLTGAIMVALGQHHAGLFCNDDRLAEALLAAGQATGDALWRMPLTPHLDDDLKSPIADLKQCAPAGSGAWGGRLLPDALHAARFLSRFVPEGTPYAHIDMAGTAERAEAEGPSPAGPTGYGVALLVRWLKSFR